MQQKECRNYAASGVSQTPRSITVGKEADLVVLGDDITKCDPEHIQDAPVLGTMIGGEWVYTRK